MLRRRTTIFSEAKPERLSEPERDRAEARRNKGGARGSRGDEDARHCSRIAVFIPSKIPRQWRALRFDSAIAPLRMTHRGEHLLAQAIPRRAGVYSRQKNTARSLRF